jgi:hypothetical protein
MVRRGLVLSALDGRHPGVTAAIGQCYCEAAAVCVERYHQTPLDCRVRADGADQSVALSWTPPEPRTIDAWANTSDATRDGAYGVSLLAIEDIYGLVAIRRAETLSGADYYLASASKQSSELEASLRLEVSGTHLSRDVVNRRLAAKVRQLRSGRSNLPGLAVVVGFKEALVAMQKVDGP